jgi:uncharacterized membrane protein YraQ (UPF0718 family)
VRIIGGIEIQNDLLGRLPMRRKKDVHEQPVHRRMVRHDLVATILTLPSLFEIPLALSMLAVGGPAGGAAALLFAGPVTNLPSLLVIGRYSSWKVAAGLAVLVWAIALAGGLLLR